MDEPEPLKVTVRCIHDLTSPSASLLNSEEQYHALAMQLTTDRPDLVIKH